MAGISISGPFSTRASLTCGLSGLTYYSLYPLCQRVQQSAPVFSTTCALFKKQNVRQLEHDQRLAHSWQKHRGWGSQATISARKNRINSNITNHIHTIEFLYVSAGYPPTLKLRPLEYFIPTRNWRPHAAITTGPPRVPHRVQ